jgi:hypothetical protein
VWEQGDRKILPVSTPNHEVVTLSDSAAASWIMSNDVSALMGFAIKSIGIIQCDNRDFCEKLFDCLAQSCGKPVREVGESSTSIKLNRPYDKSIWLDSRCSAGRKFLQARPVVGFEHTADGKNCRPYSSSLESPI